MRKVIKNGQLEIVQGGWVMSDEALPTFEARVNQMTWGHLFLNSTFDGYQPKHGWQLDPFGASRSFLDFSLRLTLGKMSHFKLFLM